MDTTQRITPYLLGRLLARLDRAGVLRSAERAYEQASIRPGAMSPWIAQATRQGKQLLIGPIMEQLPPDALAPGRVLNTYEQGEFSLGYYHEKAG